MVMINDLYEYLTSFKETGGDLVQRIRDVGVWIEDKGEVKGVFDPLINNEHFKDGDKFNPTLFYILDCYSKSSKKHIAGAEWSVIKKGVAKEVKLPKELYAAVLELENEGVAQSIQNWLKYQNAPVFEQICVLKDLREQMLKSALQMLPKGKGEINWEQKDKNAQKAKRLQKDIEDLEKSIKANTTSTLDMIQEFEKVTGVGTGLSPENNPEVK